MRTDELIAALSRNVAPVPPRAAEKRLSAASLGALAAASMVVLLAYGARDLTGAAFATGLKAALVVGLLVAAAPFALAAARPATRLKGVATPLVVGVAASALGAVVATALAPSGGRAEALFQGGLPPCLFQIPIAAAPAAVLVFWAVRSLGPTRHAMAGVAAGALSGVLAALAYAVHCQMDSAAYVLAWYPAAIALCAAVGALLGPRVLHW